jgi:hypothetical protein
LGACRNRSHVIVPVVSRAVDVVTEGDRSHISDAESPPLHETWKSYHYSKFPWPAQSMKEIEAYLDIRPILGWLSGERLPLTDRPLPIGESGTLSTMSGTIVGDGRLMLHSSSWLSTDDIQFLFAFLLRNPVNNPGFVHVIGPAITHQVAMVQSVIYEISQVKENASMQAKNCYLSNIERLHRYIDSRLDILEHKFLVYVINVGNNHWVSVVVINPFLVFEQYLKKGSDKSFIDGVWGKDCTTGWCVLDSLDHSCRAIGTHGFKATLGTTVRNSLGFHLFLNICASYLKYKHHNEGGEYNYEEPFGSYAETKGTEQFPWFDFECSSIIQQTTSFDCGLAVVANSMAFVNHLKKVQFNKSTMETHASKGFESHGIGFLLPEKMFSLRPFWEKVMTDCRSTRYGTLSDSTQLLEFMRQEFMGIVDKIAEDSVTDQKLFD